MKNEQNDIGMVCAHVLESHVDEPLFALSLILNKHAIHNSTSNVHQLPVCILQSTVCTCILNLYAMHTNDVEMRRDQMITTHEHKNPFAIHMFDVWLLLFACSVGYLLSFRPFCFHIFIVIVFILRTIIC